MTGQSRRYRRFPLVRQQTTVTIPVMSRQHLSILIRRLPHGADIPLPGYQTPDAAGMDLHAAVDEALLLRPGKTVLVPCGFAVAIPEGFEGQIRPRSGLAAKAGITVLNTPGTVDADYRGEIKVCLINHGTEDFEIVRGCRIAQMVIGPVPKVVWEETDHLPASVRDVGGFGHTGP